MDGSVGKAMYCSGRLRRMTALHNALWWLCALSARGLGEIIPMAEMMANLAVLENTELHIITDLTNPEQFHVLSELNALEVPHFIYSVQQLREKQDNLPVERCPIFGTGHGTSDDHEEEIDEEHDIDQGQEPLEDAVPPSQGKPDYDTGIGGRDKEVGTVRFTRDMHYQREHFFPMNHFHKSMFIWVRATSLKQVLEIFDKTIMWCEQKIEAGVYNSQTRFYFYVEGLDEVSGLFDHDKMRVLPRVAAIIDTPGGGGSKFSFYSYNFFHKSQGTPPIALSYVWTPWDGGIQDVARIFTDLTEFHEHHFTIATNPWSHHVLADEIPEDEGGTPTNKYRDYWGYEIDLLQFTARSLHFNYTIGNPADGKWGHIEEDGTWSGLVAEAAKGTVDFVICDMFIVYGRTQVFDATLSFDLDFMAFVTPNPRPLPKWVALIKPFDPFVWVMIGITVFFIAFVFWVVATLEGQIQNQCYNEWAVLKESLWYSYGTFVGEAVTRDTKSEHANALRWVIGAWILYCMVASYSYAGNVKSFLTNPLYSQPIDTLEGLVNSGLRWGMVLYGEEEEEMMAESTDPVFQTLWREKVVTEYSQVPQIEDVYLGKKAFIDWKSGLEPAIFVRYSTPAGDPLIFKSPRPVFMPNLPGWAFHTFNTVRLRFDEVIQKALEAGLIDHWKLRTWYGMKEKSIEDGFEPIWVEERAAISPLSLDDLQGVFYLAGLVMLVALSVHLVEVMNGLCQTGHLSPRSPGILAAKSGLSQGGNRQRMFNY